MPSGALGLWGQKPLIGELNRATARLMSMISTTHEPIVVTGDPLRCDWPWAQLAKVAESRPPIEYCAYTKSPQEVNSLVSELPEM